MNEILKWDHSHESYTCVEQYRLVVLFVFRENETVLFSLQLWGSWEQKRYGQSMSHVSA